MTMLLLLTSCRRKAAKIGAVLTPAEAVAISWHETACERYAWTRSERITHSAEAWLWTMNGSYPPFEDYARAVAIRYTGALRCTAATTQTIASQSECSPKGAGAHVYLRALRLTGFREMRPAFALELASKGRCVYGHEAG